MEEELKCPVCARLYTNPVLLPCFHNVCQACAVSIQLPAQQLSAQVEENSQGLPDYDLGDIDKCSVVSETDSGVVVNSRPNSYVGTPSIGNIYFQVTQGCVTGISCPKCKRCVYFDDAGVNCLPRNRVLENIVDKYGENKNIVVKCQLCEKDAQDAALMCEQCEVFYCESCRESCHPSRGPLAKHNLVPQNQGKPLLRAKNKSRETKCLEHTEETLSMYCSNCKLTVCCMCTQDEKHQGHDVTALGGISKAQKVGVNLFFLSLSESKSSTSSGTRGKRVP